MKRLRRFPKRSSGCTPYYSLEKTKPAIFLKIAWHFPSQHCQTLLKRPEGDSPTPRQSNPTDIPYDRLAGKILVDDPIQGS